MFKEQPMAYVDRYICAEIARLLSRGEIITCQKLAANVDCSVMTIKRGIKRLENAGHIKTSRPGMGHVLQFEVLTECHQPP